MPDDKGFEVRDKRKVKLDAEGDAARTEERPAAEKPVHEKRAESGKGAPQPEEEPVLDFVSFVGSLGATALMYMGEMVSPDQPQGLTDLKGAKQMIDLIDMLKQKTMGNLDKEESEMVDNLLYNLRIRYVRLTTRK